jgi:putative transposase
VGEICPKAGISEATCYDWRKKYGGLMPSEIERLRQLEEGNGKLKKIVADLALDKEMPQDAPKALRLVRRRKLVEEARGEWGVSIRPACRVFLVPTSTYHCKSRRAGEAGLEQRIKEIRQTRVRTGRSAKSRTSHCRAEKSVYAFDEEEKFIA